MSASRLDGDMYSAEAEQAVIGALLLVPESWHLVSDMMQERDFFRRDHQLIWRAINDLQDADTPPDAVTLGEWFESNSIADLVGGEEYRERHTGARYILELANTTPSAANIVAYAEIVCEYSRKRQVVDAATELGSAIRKPGSVARNVAADAVTKLIALSDGSENSGAVRLSSVGPRVMQGIQNRFDNPDVLNGLALPWSALNDALDGFENGNLIVLAARPSIGKTAAALNIIAHWCLKLRLHGALFQLEMSEDATYKALMPIVCAGLTRKFLRRPTHGEDLSRFLGPAQLLVESMSLELDCRAGLTAAQICARARRLHQKKKLQFVVVDHAHIVRLLGKQDARIELGYVSTMLKALAKELNCPVILLAQLNRDLEKRADKRPIMSDLREAGGFEQDADVIIFLHRDERYAKQERRAEKNPGTMEWVIAKQRESELANVFTGWDGARGYLPDITYEPEPEIVFPARTKKGDW